MIKLLVMLFFPECKQHFQDSARVHYYRVPFFSGAFNSGSHFFLVPFLPVPFSPVPFFPVPFFPDPMPAEGGDKYRQLLQLLLFVGCLSSQKHAGVSQERICSTVQAATPRYKLQIKLAISSSQSILTPNQASPSVDPKTPATFQGSHWSTHF